MTGRRCWGSATIKDGLPIQSMGAGGGGNPQGSTERVSDPRKKGDSASQGQGAPDEDTSIRNQRG